MQSVVTMTCNTKLAILALIAERLGMKRFGDWLFRQSISLS